MLFAKASLSAVFFLGLTNFGESQHLNNYDNSTVKNVVPRMVHILKDYDGRIYAEQCRKTILQMLEKWAATGPFVIAKWGKTKSIRKQDENVLDMYKPDKSLKGRKGIYFIFCTDYKKNEYPVYVGMTSQQSFYDRLRQHKTEVLANIHFGKWGVNFCDTFDVYVKDLEDLLTIKFLESTFLAAFNFARNTEENIGTRRLDDEAIAFDFDGKEHFKTTFTKKIEILQNIGNTLVG